MSAGMGVARIALAVTLVLGSSAISLPKELGQDVASDTALKRKVKLKVMPDYPPIARQMNLVGKVKIETTIASDGRVTSTRVVGGNPVLASAALDALRKWRFEPGPKDTTEIVQIEFSGKE